MQKSRQKVKITHNLTTQNNHIDIVIPLLFLPVHMYIIKGGVLHVYPLFPPAQLSGKPWLFEPPHLVLSFAS